jgi:hypothetical protein
MGSSQQVNSDRAPHSARRAALPPFKDLFCTYTHSPLEKFELTLFKKSLYPHARLIAPILLRLKRQWFAEDLDVIRELATVDCPEVFQMEVARFYGRNVRDRSFLRKRLLIRLSGKRLLKWKTRCFAAAEEMPELQVAAA